MSRPQTVGAYPRFRSLSAYGVAPGNTGDFDDLNAAPPPPPPPPAGPSPILLLAIAGAAWWYFTKT